MAAPTPFSAIPPAGVGVLARSPGPAAGPAVPALARPASIRRTCRAGGSPGHCRPCRRPGQYPVQLVLDDDTWESILGVGGAHRPAVPVVQPLFFARAPSPSKRSGCCSRRVETVAGRRHPAGGLPRYRRRSRERRPPARPPSPPRCRWPTTTPFRSTPWPRRSRWPSGGEVWIGVINRWVVPGVTPLSTPATIDTNSNLGLSGFATWAGSPPDPPRPGERHLDPEHEHHAVRRHLHDPRLW